MKKFSALQLLEAACYLGDLNLAFQDIPEIQGPESVLKILNAGLRRIGLDMDSESGKELLHLIQTPEGKGNLCKAFQVLGDLPPQKEKVLRPVLEIIGKGPKAKHKFHFAPGPVTTNEDFFPIPDSEGVETSGLEKLWEGFQTQFLLLPNQSISGWLTSLRTLLFCQTSHLPAPAGTESDVSFFDFVNARAGLAICYFRGLEEGTGEGNPFLLIGGDVSGIQDFIYDIISKNAAKLLKGRSFYLYLLVKSILSEILEEISGRQCQVVYDSGGGFFLLAPNTDEIRQKLLQLEPSIGKRLFKVHKIQLSFMMDTLPFGLEDVQEAHFPKLWDEMNARINARKKQKFIGEIEDIKSFFQLLDVGLEQQRDGITNEELPIGKEQDYYLGTKDDPIYVLPSTKEQVELGKSLRGANWWIRSKERLSGIDARGYKPCKVGLWNYLLTHEEFQEHESKFKNAEVISFNTDATGFVSPFAYPIILSDSRAHDFYGGNSFIADEETGYPIPFDALVDQEDEISFKRLGVLKMDVDNLGERLSSGLGEKASLARYAATSRSLDYFFKGWLNDVREADMELFHHTLVIYAGGDDLFIVGKWDLLFMYAQAIREKFDAWTGNNPELTLSGGMAIVTPKFPIIRAAIYAGDAEKLAKSHTHPFGDKDSFTLLGKPLQWEVDLHKVKELRQQIGNAIEEDNEVNRSLTRKIHTHHLAYKTETQEGLPETWRWRMAWDFNRLSSRIPSDHESAMEKVREFNTNSYTNSWKGNPNDSEYEYLELLNLAARWADLERRSNKE